MDDEASWKENTKDRGQVNDSEVPDNDESRCDSGAVDSAEVPGLLGLA